MKLSQYCDTFLINPKVLNSFVMLDTIAIEKITIKSSNKYVFLDRDGVINEDTGYLCDNYKLKFIPGSLEAMRLLQNNGLKLVIITNQSGLARGYFNFTKFTSFMKHYFERLSENGINKPFFYFCPHHPSGSVKAYSQNCSCRKPLPGMILKAASELKINLQNSYLIGDKPIDVAAGYAAGIPNLFLLSQSSKIRKRPANTLISDCLLSVAKLIIKSLN